MAPCKTGTLSHLDFLGHLHSSICRQYGRIIGFDFPGGILPGACQATLQACLSISVHATFKAHTIHHNTGARITCTGCDLKYSRRGKSWICMQEGKSSDVVLGIPSIASMLAWRNLTRRCKQKCGWWAFRPPSLCVGSTSTDSRLLPCGKRSKWPVR